MGCFSTLWRLFRCLSLWAHTYRLYLCRTLLQSDCLFPPYADQLPPASSSVDPRTLFLIRALALALPVRRSRTEQVPRSTVRFDSVSNLGFRLLIKISWHFDPLPCRSFTRVPDGSTCVLHTSHGSQHFTLNLLKLPPQGPTTVVPMQLIHSMVPSFSVTTFHLQPVTNSPREIQCVFCKHPTSLIPSFPEAGSSLLSGTTS